MKAFIISFMPHYRGYLNAKHVLPRESIFYHIGAVFLSFFIFLVLFYFNTDPILACGTNVLLSISAFTLLFRLNNYFYGRDKILLEQLIVSHRIDSMKLLSAFYLEVRLVTKNSEEKKKPTTEVSLGRSGDISTLFERVFREHAGDLIQLFKIHKENFFGFLEALTPDQLEMLYRYYLVE